MLYEMLNVGLTAKATLYPPKANTSVTALSNSTVVNLFDKHHKPGIIDISLRATTKFKLFLILFPSAGQE